MKKATVIKKASAAKKVIDLPTENTSLAVVKSEANTLALRVQKTTVISQETLVSATDLLKNVIAVRKKAETMFDPQVDAAYKSWQIAINQKKTFIGPLLAAEKDLKEKTGKYIIEQDRILEQQRLKAEEAARKKEEKIKAKLQKKIDGTSDSETKAILEEQKENVLVSPDTAYLPTTTKVDGMVKQNDYKIEVIDKEKLLQAIMDGDLDIDIDSLVDMKISVLKAYLKNSGKDKIAGCVVTKTVIQKFK
jgi:thiamine biosynthesis lipoprotein ApbE